MEARDGPGSAGMRVLLLRSLTRDNDRRADNNRAFLDSRSAVAVNFIGSPGSGKTTMLEATVAGLRDRLDFAVIEGDLATSRDGQRLSQLGIPVVQINTLGACHLDASMVSKALAELPPAQGVVVLIENVGNLVCPASFRLGERLRVVVLSVAEGSDKVAKYPATFCSSDCVLITKADLIGHADFDLTEVEHDLRQMEAKARVILASSRTGYGMAEWLTWLEDQIGGRRCQEERL